MKTNLLNKVVFGLVGIGSINSKYNGSFEGLPLEHNGQWVAHDTALKYMFKIEQKIRGEKVLGLKSQYIKVEDPSKKKQPNKKNIGKLSCKTFEQVFEEKTKLKVDDNTRDDDILKLLFGFKDVKNFGMVFPIKGHSFGITGVVQMNTAINTYDYTELCEETILAPYSSGETKSQATNGIKAYLDEAHFVHDFVVCPNNIKVYKDLGIEGVGEYTREDYEDFKDVITCCATNYRSKAKEGCNNEFALFIEMKDQLHGNMIGTLNKLVKVAKEGDMTVIDLSKVAQQLEDIREYIDNIEIQYSPYITKINFPMNFDNIKYKNIVSKKLI